MVSLNQWELTWIAETTEAKRAFLTEQPGGKLNYFMLTFDRSDLANVAGADDQEREARVFALYEFVVNNLRALASEKGWSLSVNYPRPSSEVEFFDGEVSMMPLNESASAELATA